MIIAGSKPWKGTGLERVAGSMEVAWVQLGGLGGGRGVTCLETFRVKDRETGLRVFLVTSICQIPFKFS